MDETSHTQRLMKAEGRGPALSVFLVRGIALCGSKLTVV
jgi:hypothetical protein